MATMETWSFEWRSSFVRYALGLFREISFGVLVYVGVAPLQLWGEVECQAMPFAVLSPAVFSFDGLVECAARRIQAL